MEEISPDNWKDQKNEVITVIKKSRKAYLLEYICGFFLLFSMFFFSWKGIHFPPVVVYFILTISLFALLSAEWSRSLMRYKITNSKIIVINGYIKQNKKNVYFHPLSYVPDINVKQTRWQRMMNYGTIYFRGSEEAQFEIKDIDRPHAIIKMIEELIEMSKTMESRRR